MAATMVLYTYISNQGNIQNLTQLKQVMNAGFEI